MKLENSFVDWDLSCEYIISKMKLLKQLDRVVFGRVQLLCRASAVNLLFKCFHFECY